MKKRIKKYITDLLKDESGQGTTEYILILVGVVAIGIFFGPKLSEIVQKMVNEDLTAKIGQFMSGI